MFGRGRKFDRIDLAVKPGRTISECEHELQALLGPGFQVEPPSGRGRQFEAMLAQYPDLYLDTTMVVGRYFERQPDVDILRRHPGRILYGTDFPNIPYEWDHELKALRALRLPAADEERILSGNALRLFGP